MKLESIIALLGGGTKIIGTASSATMLAGLIYLVDCRISARGEESVDRCYFTALPMMGIGIAGRGGFSAGYNTYNPALRRKEEENEGRLEEKPAEKERKEEKRKERAGDEPVMSRQEDKAKEERDGSKRVERRGRDEHGRFTRRSRRD